MKDYHLNSEDEVGQQLEDKQKRIKEMTKFSGESWDNLQDIWPAHLRISSEIYSALGVFYPVWVNLNKRYRQQFKESLGLRDLFLLFLFHRVEEAKGDVGAPTFILGVMIDVNYLNLLPLKKSTIHRLKLIEQYPMINGYRPRIYRLTSLGKQILRETVELVEQAHRDVRLLTASEQPHSVAKNKKYFEDYFAQEE